MNEWLELVLKLMMVMTTIAALMTLISRAAWMFFYYVLACRNPIGKTVLTSIAALWLICAGLLAII